MYIPGRKAIANAQTTHAQSGSNQGIKGCPGTRLDIQSTATRAVSTARETTPDTANVEKLYAVPGNMRGLQRIRNAYCRRYIAVRTSCFTLPSLTSASDVLNVIHHSLTTSVSAIRDGGRNPDPRDERKRHTKSKVG